MIGAPAEELSAAVQWYFWKFIFAILFRDIMSCILIDLHFQDAILRLVVNLILGSLSFSVVLTMD